MKVGFLGVGNLGGPVCDLVVKAGHEVAVYDPVEANVAPRIRLGATAVASPAEAAADAEVVIVFVRDDPQAIDAVTGPQGVLTTARPGTVVVVHSTLTPAAVRQLAAACSAGAVRFLDVGVTAGFERDPVQVFCMVGGDEADLAFVRPVLEPYSRNIVRFGGTGTGMAAKIVRNLMGYSYWVMIHEGMALAERAGLDLEAFGALFAESVPSTYTMIVERPTMVPMALDDPDREKVAFLENVVGLGWKDLDAAAELAREVELEIPLSEVVRRRYGPAIGLALEPPVDQAPGPTPPAAP